ncbi:thiaminase II/PqqC family protein [Plantactinospora sonchi]|uniref:Thiaminase-2/PQQC domain-containing protein n=1 Tax=Plantactinospora sonchi TaxID=1544735 RepID=A0ABU7RTH3_9ACTN
MTTGARELLETMRARADIDPLANPFVAAVVEGRAPVASVAAFAAEERHIIPSDRRSFLLLAARAEEPVAVEFFTTLAQGENLVLPMVSALAAGAGMAGPALAAYEPQAGCQAYPGYVAWLALNADPAGAALALVANFAAWGGYCAALAGALRERYGFDDTSCAFLDFFATPAPGLAEQAVRAAQEALDAGRPLTHARRYARLLHDVETTFWHTLAAVAH